MRRQLVSSSLVWKMEGNEDFNKTILLEANLLLLLLMKRRLTHKNGRKHRFCVRRIFEEREQWGMCICSQSKFINSTGIWIASLPEPDGVFFLIFNCRPYPVLTFVNLARLSTAPNQICRLRPSKRWVFRICLYTLCSIDCINIHICEFLPWTLLWKNLPCSIFEARG